jgi:hypothetical protein
VRSIAGAVITAWIVAAGGCTDADPGAKGTPSAGATTAAATTTSARARPTSTDATAQVASPCSILDASDFAAAGLTVDGPGVDVSASIGLATSTSAACQWNGEGTWDLLVGRGGAINAYEFDRGFFAELDTVNDLDAGNFGYILDREDVATPEDYDHEAGVLVGDLYFTLSTTDDDGGEGLERLAHVVAERLGSSG